MKIKKGNLLTVLLSMLCAVLLCCSVGLFNGINNKTARAQAPAAGDVIIGELALDATSGTADSSGKVFDNDNLTALYDAILGDGYSGNGTLNNIKKLLDLKGTAKLGSGVATKSLNAEDFRTLGGKNIYVTYGGIQWEAVYLTTNKSGEIILDLWQATNTLTSPFSYGGTSTPQSGTASAISNIYGTSYIRCYTLSNGGTYRKYTTTTHTDAGTAASVTIGTTGNYSKFTTGNFANYIDKPLNVDYQEKESWVEINGETGANFGVIYNQVSDAYGTPTAENYYQGGVNNTTTDRPNFNSNYTDHAADTINRYGAVVSVPSNYKAGYEDWQNDRVWLPSITETGMAVSGTQTAVAGIWGLSDYQRKNNASNTVGTPSSNATQVAHTWLRSGFFGNANYSCSLAGNATLSAYTGNASLAVRPAIHLNLTKADAVTTVSEIPVPQNVTVDYDGNAKWLDTIEPMTDDAGNFKFKWIDTALHDNTGIVSVKKIDYSSINSSGAYAASATDITSGGTGGIVHAGKYEITLKIDTANTNYRWRDEDATVTEKTFTVTVSQLEMKYDLKLYDYGGNEHSDAKSPYDGNPVEVRFVPESLTTPSSANKPDPNSTVTVYHQGRGTTTYAKSTTGPTDAGLYTATWTDSTTVSDYKLVRNGSSNSATLDYEITKAVVTLPTVNTAAKPYDGTAQDYVLSGYDKNLINLTGVRVTNAAGTSYVLTNTPGTKEYKNTGNGGDYTVTLDDSTSTIKVEVTDAGDYKLEFGLVDTVNSEWDSSVNLADLTASFTLNRAVIGVDFAAPGSTGFSWQVGSTGVLKLSQLSGVQNGEKVTVKMYWYKSTDTSSIYTMYSTGDPDNTAGYAISQFDNFGSGTYYLCAVLDDDSTGDNVNRNYKIDETDANTSTDGVHVQQIDILAGAASLDSIVWQYQAGAAGVPANVKGATITYDKVGGNAVLYTVKVINLPSYCNIVGYNSDATQSDAGSYTATVKIEIDSTKRGDNKMPKNSDYTYQGDGTNYQYVNDYTCTIDLVWTIEQKEIDLSGLPFYYTNSYDNGGNEIWAKYDSANPPEGSGLNTKAMIDSTDYIDGVTGVTFHAGTDMKGPGTIHFDFEFTLDSNHKSQSGSTTVDYQMELTGKQIKVQWKNNVTLKKPDGSEWKSNTNVPFKISELNLDAANKALISDYLTYEYYDGDPATGGKLIVGGLEEIIKSTADGGMGACDNPVTVYVHPVLVGVPQKNGVDEYVLSFASYGDEYKKITIGDNKDPVDLTAGTLTSITYGNPNGDSITDAFKATVQASGQPLNPNWYTVTLRDSKGNDLGAVSGIDLSTLDADEYVLVFAITSTFEDDYVFTDETLPFEVKPVELAVPTLKDGVTLTFSGVDQYLKDNLQNWDDRYMEFASNSIHEAYHADTYKAVIQIKEFAADGVTKIRGNYIFVNSAPTAGTTKLPVKGLVDDAVTLPQLSPDKSSVTMDWTINKYVFDTTQKSAWNFAKDGATLSFNGVPTTIKALTLGDNPSLKFGVAYYDLDGNFLPDVELKGGNKFQVAAYLDPSCADAKDVEFKGATYDALTQMTTSPKTAYTVPKSGAAALMGNVKDFVTKTWLGLPIWAWLLIALAVLILLIIIIVVACKRRKSKEEKAEAKARKEEEKQRREEERRMQQERLEAERELARAKQEAELEKIRMQAQMAGAAGMASMAVQQPQQQPAQQQMPQPVQQQMPMQQQMPQQQPAYYNQPSGDMAAILAKIEAELAMLRADRGAQQGGYSAPMYGPQPAGDMSAVMLAKMEAEFAKMQAKQEASQEVSAAKMELEFFKLHGIPMNYASLYGYNQLAQQAGKPVIDMPRTQGNYSADEVGAIMAAMMRNMGVGANELSAVKPAELPQVTEESQNSSSATYPPDAVITTTTTVDTTKKGADSQTVRSEHVDDGRLFDIDGFYDNFENK